MSPDAGSNGRRVALAQRGLQVALVGLVGYGAVTGRVGVAVNGALALAVTFFPDLLERRYDHRVDPRLGLWIAVAATVHTAGFLGPYSAKSGLLAWYDQAAHAISAAFVAGVGYALVDALDRGTDRVNFPEEFRFVFVLAFILAFGVLWEVAEFGGGAAGTFLTGQELLVQYGVEDIASDLTFNTLAAAAVALWGTGYFDDVADIYAGRFSRDRER